MIHPAYSRALEQRNPAVKAAADTLRSYLRAHWARAGRGSVLMPLEVHTAEADLNEAVEDATCGLRAS
jgi:hypothetical protein